MPSALLKTRPLLLALGSGLVALVVIVLVIVSILRSQSTFTLSESLPTKGVSQFASNAKAVPNWQKVVENDVPSTDSGLQPVSYKSKKNSCNLTTAASFLPAYNAGRGDQYNSYNWLYQNGTQVSALLKADDPVYISSSDGKRIQFASGHYTFTQSGAKQVTYVAARAVNTAYTNPLAAGTTGKDIYGNALDKGVPVLAVAYSCTQKDVSVAEFNTLLDALSINLK